MMQGINCRAAVRFHTSRCLYAPFYQKRAISATCVSGQATSSSSSSSAPRTDPFDILREAEAHRRKQEEQARQSSLMHRIVPHDDPRQKWSDLSGGQRVVRSTALTGNALIIVVAAAVLGVAAYSLVDAMTGGEVKIASEAFDRIKADPTCIQMIGPANTMKQVAQAVTPGSGPPRRSNGVPQSTSVHGRDGLEHVHVRFWVLGDNGSAEVFAYVVRNPKAPQGHDWRSLYVDVPTRENRTQRITLIDPTARSGGRAQLAGSNFLTRLFGGS